MSQDLIGALAVAAWGTIIYLAAIVLIYSIGGVL